MYIDLSSKADSLAQKLLSNKLKESQLSLRNYFLPVIEELEVVRNKGRRHAFDGLELEEVNKIFIPVLEESELISSILLADEDGNEVMILHQDSTIINRQTFLGGDSIPSNYYEWLLTCCDVSLLNKTTLSKDYDPRNRPWYNLTMKNGLDTVSCTAPYLFFTTKEPGITISTGWVDSKGKKHVVAFDILLSAISNFTLNSHVSKNGFVIITSSDFKILGLPKNEKYDDPEWIQKDILKDLDSLNNPIISIAKQKWEAGVIKKEYFSFDNNDQTWWGMAQDIEFGSQSFHIAVFTPQSDFFAEIKKTKWLIIFSFSLVALTLFSLSFVYARQTDLYKQLNIQNKLVKVKNKEILESINYAKRLQSALFSSIDHINEHIPDSFVLYKPKDIVAGDFFWMKNVDNKTLFATADCTGHGVPGAMVSIVCIGILNRIISENKLVEPGIILDKARELVSSAFGDNSNVKDGMDISLCSLEGSDLYFAGAYRPLWLIRKGSSQVEEIKGDRQPIGQFEKPIAFTTHHIKLNPGDSFYIFSDGFADQFGGEDGKKLKTAMFKKQLLSIQHLSMADQKQVLENFFNDWKGPHDQVDDVSLFGAKV